MENNNIEVINDEVVSHITQNEDIENDDASQDTLNKLDEQGDK